MSTLVFFFIWQRRWDGRTKVAEARGVSVRLVVREERGLYVGAVYMCASARVLVLYVCTSAIYQQRGVYVCAVYMFVYVCALCLCATAIYKLNLCHFLLSSSTASVRFSWGFG